MINSQQRQKVFKKPLIFLIVIFLHCFQLTLQQGLIYDLQHTFETNLNSILAIAICPYDDNFAIGAKDGKIYIYNYNDFNANPIQLKGHSSKIVQILWAMPHQGLISVSSDSQKVSSLAIQWNTSFQQTFRWNFNTIQTFGASITLGTFQTYVLFNQKTRVYQYILWSKQITKALGSRTGFSDAKYSNGYRYMYVTQGPRIFTYTCGTNYGFFYQFTQTFSQISPDFANQTGNLMIVKQNDEKFSVFSRDGTRIIIGIPIPNIIRFKYCQQKYIIGLDSSKNLYIADKFTFQVQQTLSFKKNVNVQVTSFICDKKKILVGYSNGQVDMYKLSGEDAGFDYITLIIILVCLLVVLGIIFIVWKKVIQKKRLAKKKKEESLISQKYSPQSQLMAQK